MAEPQWPHLRWADDVWELQYVPLRDDWRMADELTAVNGILDRINANPSAADLKAEPLRGDGGTLAAYAVVTRTRTLEPCVLWNIREGESWVLWVGNADLTTLTP